MAAPTAGPGLVLELWYADLPDLADPDLLAALQARNPHAEAQGGSLSVPRPDLTRERDGRQVPLLTVVVPASPLGTDGKARPDASQTWDWADADVAVARCQASVLVTEMFADGFSPAERLQAMADVVQILVATTRPEVLSWPQSQRVSNPATFRPGSLEGVVNVRFFAVGDSDAEPEVAEMVMDTLGLHVFGLPDIQCHYRGADPAEIAALLFGTAEYLFEAGDVIADGHTISGVDGTGRYRCRHEQSLVGPARAVIDVNLGSPYAAGRRDRTG